MKCRRVRSKIALRSERQPSHSEAVEIKRHLVECSSCRDAAAVDEQIAVLLNATPPLTPEEGGWERLRGRIEEDQTRRRKPLLKPVYTIASVACIILVIIGLLNTFKGGRSFDRTADHNTQKQNRVRKVAVVPGQKEQQVNAGMAQPIQPGLRQAVAPDGGQKKAAVVTVAKGQYRKVNHKPVRTAELHIPVTQEKSFRKRVMIAANTNRAVPKEKPVENTASYPTQQAPSEPTTQHVPSSGQYVSAEMADLISEGMSVLVEASEELSQNRENQL